MKRSLHLMCFKIGLAVCAMFLLNSNLFAQTSEPESKNYGSPLNESSAQPFKLFDFNAFFDKKNVNLSWSKVNEENIDQFIVERSSDGKTYEKIAVVFADEHNQVNSFNYKDVNVISPSGILFYR